MAERRDGAPGARGGCLAGVKVIEVADEQGEYAGLLLGGLGADVVKVEPPDGSPTRRIGPFLDSIAGPERSLFFWHYNRGKRSVSLDLDQEADRKRLRRLVTEADVLLDTTPALYLDERDIGLVSLREVSPALITARITPFGESGPWSGWKGSDLVHLALAGPMMNCGYDPLPDGTYDLARRWRPKCGTRTTSRGTARDHDNRCAYRSSVNRPGPTSVVCGAPSGLNLYGT